MLLGEQRLDAYIESLLSQVIIHMLFFLLSGYCYKRFNIDNSIEGLILRYN